MAARPARFFGVSDAKLLQELNLPPTDGSRLLPKLAEKALAFAELPSNAMGADASLKTLIAQYLESPNSVCLAPNRPPYARNRAVKAELGSDQDLYSIQLVRQACYSDWLSAPYPAGDWRPIPAIALENAGITDLLGWHLPIMVELNHAVRLPGTTWRTAQFTDVELRALRSWLDNAAPGWNTVQAVKSAWYTPAIKGPPAIPAPSTYTWLNPAWGLYLEARATALQAVTKTEQGWRVSEQGRMISAVEMANLAPILLELEAHPELAVLGWGCGRIHLAAPTEWTQSDGFQKVLAVASEQGGYLHSQAGVWTDRETGEHSPAYNRLAAYKRLISQPGGQELASIIEL